MKTSRLLLPMMAASCIVMASCSHTRSRTRATARETALKNIEFTLGPSTAVRGVSVPDSIFDGVLFNEKDQEFLIKVVTSASSSMFDVMSQIDASADKLPDFSKMTASTFDTSTIAQELMAQSFRTGSEKLPHRHSGWRVKVDYSVKRDGVEANFERWCYLDPSGTSVVKFFDIPLNAF